jgi:hypothetical protein
MVYVLLCSANAARQRLYIPDALYFTFDRVLSFGKCETPGFEFLRMGIGVAHE